MPQKSLLTGFGDSDFQLNPYIRDPLITDNIQQTLARLAGYNDSEKRFKLLRTDTDGKLLVSTASGKTATGQISQVVGNGVHNLLVAANNSRRVVSLINVGIAIARITFDSALGAANFFTIQPNGVYSTDVYIGALYGTGTAPDVIQIIEL